MLVQFRDPNLSLWQSAMDSTIHQAAATWVPRPDLAAVSKEGMILREVASHCAAVVEKVALSDLLIHPLAFAQFLHLPRPATVHETVSYCSMLWKQIAEARLLGDAAELAKLEREKDFGSCDPRYAQAVEKYIEYFKLRRQPIPYISPRGGDFAVEPIADKCKIALVGDWGTGQEPARTVLERIKIRDPDIIIHLGDIYYSGTKYEAENYFLKLFEAVFGATGGNARPRVLTMAGNHDMYAGGIGYYWLLQQLGQSASYFCLQNSNWRFIAVDTGYNDHDPLTVNTTATRLQDKELEWLGAQVAGANGARTILLSHHPLFSAFEDINGKPVNDLLLQQVNDLLPHITAWFWGHEHNLVVYKEYLNIHARLVGHGAFPVAVSELSPPKHPIPFHQEVVLGNDGTCFNHGYALITLTGSQARADYFECLPTGDKLNHTESLNELP
jgi:3',5'-cyclic AMP phosphodiesterase CpdA